ncbi:uncharacterized protein LOC110600120 isoform X2 [Manihot esculenta]|uniref:uncharacterized protein LOC110600120 isoform X2 n=1 Tax=Manihot esculenta TaxID=3983 RepID=UPI000B5D373E|nr:uncharacterized protein LOC110600120 isoform X2 [Manihot esculenta]
MRVLRSLLSQQIGSRNWMSAREGSCDRTIGRYSGSDSKASAIMSAQFYGKMHENSREQGQGDEQQLDGTRDISMSCWQEHPVHQLSSLLYCNEKGGAI